MPFLNMSYLQVPNGAGVFKVLDVKIHDEENGFSSKARKTSNKR